MSFVLSLIIVVGGLLLEDKRAESSQVLPPSSSIEQNTKGAQSPAVSSGKDVQIQYGTPTPPEKSSNHKATGNAKSTANQPSKNSQSNINQQTNGNQSPAVKSGGDVDIQYGRRQ